MTSKKFQRYIRQYAEGLDLIYIKITDGGQHTIMHFMSVTNHIQIPVPKGDIDETGRLIQTIRAQIRSAARNNAIVAIARA